MEDQGSASLTEAWPHPVDDYVWLGGRPVAFLRSKFNSGEGWERQPDMTGTCTRRGEAMDCGVYFIVTDHIGKPVLVLNQELKVAGAADYEPFGHVNRITKLGDTAHPYTNGLTGQVVASFVQPADVGTTTELRARFNLVDTENCGTTNYDHAELTDSDGEPLGSSTVGGLSKSGIWSEWVTVPANGQVDVRYTSDGQNYWPDWSGCIDTRYTGYWYSGVVVAGYEYRRQWSTKWEQPHSGPWVWRDILGTANIDRR